MPTRRELILSAVPIATAAATTAAHGATPERPTPQSAPQPFHAGFLKPLVSHLGYRTSGSKNVVIKSAPGVRQARIVRMKKLGMDASLVVPLHAGGKDFGDWLHGDFSALTEPGTYRAAIAFQLFSGMAHPTDSGGKSVLQSSLDAWSRGIVEAWSQDFVVSDKPWDDTIRKMMGYYQAQRCGASPHGYNTPCHIGPIAATDGRAAKPITGAWHSADDHVRDVPEILHGMFGLLQLAETRPDLAAELNAFDELRWGNDYFLSLQDPRGYIYFGVFTKNYYGETNLWDTSSYELRTEPGPRYCQYMFTAFQAQLARLYRKSEPRYAAKCLAAARRCFAYWEGKPGGDWASSKYVYELGTACYAAAQLYRCTGSAEYRDHARTLAGQLMALQNADGFWPERAGADLDPRRDYNLVIARGIYQAYAPLGLCAVAEAMPTDAAAPRWRAALGRFADGFAAFFATANAFGMLPYYVFRDPATPQVRTRGGKSYRYFLDPSHTAIDLPGSRTIPWQTGNQSTTAGFGVALCAIGRLLGRDAPRQLAQRQLDWISGLNPFDSCQILGLGRNNPVTYPPLDFMPPVPAIVGAGLQGACGDDTDEPQMVGGYYGSGEYWLPPHSWILGLLATLSA